MLECGGLYSSGCVDDNTESRIPDLGFSAADVTCSMHNTIS